MFVILGILQVDDLGKLIAGVLKVFGGICVRVTLFTIGRYVSCGRF